MELRELRKNNKFPDQETKQRNQEITINQRLIDSEQSQVYLDAYTKRLRLAGVVHRLANKVMGFAGVKAYNSDILQGVNTVEPICDVYATILFNGEIKFTSKTNQGIIDNFVTDNNFLSLCYSAQHENGYKGDTVFKIYQKDDEIKIKNIPAEYWIPIYENGEFKYDGIFEEIKIKDRKNKSHKFLRVELHSPGEIIYRCYQMKSDTLGDQIDWNEELLGKLPENTSTEDNKDRIFNTDINYSLIQRVPNRIRIGKNYGKPFVTKTIRGHELEICIRKTQDSKILDKHSEPGMYGPKKSVQLDEDGKPRVQVSGKYMEVSKNDVAPGYLTWNGNLEDSRQNQQSSKRFIYEETGLNPAIMASSIEGLNVMSGTALEKIFARTIGKCDTLKSNWTPVIKRIFAIVGQLEGIDLKEINIDWSYYLPQSQNEKIDMLIKANGGLAVISHEESVKKANPNMKETEIKETVNEIKAQSSVNLGIDFGFGNDQ